MLFWQILVDGFAISALYALSNDVSMRSVKKAARGSRSIDDEAPRRERSGDAELPLLSSPGVRECAGQHGDGEIGWGAAVGDGVDDAWRDPNILMVQSAKNWCRQSASDSLTARAIRASFFRDMVAERQGQTAALNSNFSFSRVYFIIGRRWHFASSIALIAEASLS